MSKMLNQSLVLMLDCTEQQWVTMLQYKHRIQLVMTKTKQHTSITTNNLNNKKQLRYKQNFS